MATNEIFPPFPIFPDIDSEPLESGYIYIGQDGLDAENNPIQVYWDEALTITADQPVRTLSGYLQRNGSPGRLYANADSFSITVRNKNGALIYSSLSTNRAIPFSDITGTANLITKVNSIAALVGGTFSEEAINVLSYYGGWEFTSSPKGGAIWYKTGATADAPSVGTPVTGFETTGRLGGGDGGGLYTGQSVQAGYGWDTAGVEWKIIAQDFYSPLQVGATGDGIADDRIPVRDADTLGGVKVDNIYYIATDLTLNNKFQVTNGSWSVNSTATLQGPNTFILAEWFGAVGNDAGATDSTDMVAAAGRWLEQLPNAGGGSLNFLAGTFKFNLELVNQQHVVGAGSRLTTFIPASNDHLIKTSVTDSTVRIRFKGFRIDGSATKGTYASQDGIRLESTTASTFVDDISIEDVEVLDCGQYGIRARGTSTSGPFVQKLHLERVVCQANTLAGISFEGDVIETVLDQVTCTSNGPDSGATPNAEFKITGGRSPSRILILGGLWNHNNALSNGNAGTALLVEGTQQLKITTADFENADPFIKIENATNGNVSIDTTNFGTIYAITNGIEIDNCNGLKAFNNKFQGAGVTITNAWKFNGGLSSCKGVDIDDTNRYGNVTNIIDQFDNTTISGGNINFYRRKDFRVDTEGAAASDDLNNIYDENGGTSTALLANGTIASFHALDASRTVVVKHATGNIRTKDGLDVTLDETWKTFTCKWEERLSLWLEV